MRIYALGVFFWQAKSLKRFQQNLLVLFIIQKIHLESFIPKLFVFYGTNLKVI